MQKKAQKHAVTKTFDLETMTVDELWLLHEELSVVLASRLTSEKRELEKRLAQLRRDETTVGMERPQQVNGEPERLRRPYPQVLPKYRNPANPNETWSGRGKQPRWVSTALKAGHHMDEFLISRSEHSRDRR